MAISRRRPLFHARPDRVLPIPAESRAPLPEALPRGNVFDGHARARDWLTPMPRALRSATYRPPPPIPIRNLPSRWCLEVVFRPQARPRRRVLPRRGRMRRRRMRHHATASWKPTCQSASSRSSPSSSCPGQHFVAIRADGDAHLRSASAAPLRRARHCDTSTSWPARPPPGARSSRTTGNWTIAPSAATKSPQRRETRHMPR